MFVLQESCKLKFHLARILQDEVYLARILQETCQKNALSCKILQDILQDSCKICIFFQLGIAFEIREGKQSFESYQSLRVC